VKIRIAALVAVTCGALATAGQAVDAQARPAYDLGGSRTSASPAEPNARVLWDASANGTEVVSARLDGSDRAVLYQQERGASDNLVVSPDYQSVAFSPTARRGRPARLLVTNTSAPGRARNVLPRSPVVLVGAIGWSRDSRRLFFEGLVEESSAGSFYPSYLFSVSARGGHLRRGRRLSDGRQSGAVYGSILQTRRGIVVPAWDRILLYPTLRPGARPRLIARNAFDVRPTGNGQWLFYRHIPRHGRQSLRRVRATGGRPVVVKWFREDLRDLFYSFVPDHAGRRLLASGQIDIDRPPRTAIFDTATLEAEELPIARNTISLAW
jgi:hypothetical protein